MVRKMRFLLFNLFGGKFNLSDGQTAEKAILLPLAPEYIGYADVHVEGQHFISVKPKIENVEHEGEAGFSNTAWTLTRWRACLN